MSKIDYATPVTTLSGEETNLEAYEGKVLLIVNTASKCGFTPQYEGLEQLHQRFAGDGLAILGFPCNQFGAQEPGDASEIASFCELNYGVQFSMFEKVDVNGPEAHPLFESLKAAAPGVLGSTAIKWNFTKFLVGRDGTVLKRFGSMEKPESLVSEIEAALG